MKKVLAIILAITFVMNVSPATVFAAEPPYNGNETGTVTWDAAGVLSGSLTGDYGLTVMGQVTGSGDQLSFTGTISGDINGSVAGGINTIGIDTLSGTITGTSAAEPVRIIGYFPLTGTSGDFIGKIITDTVTPVLAESIAITTAGNITSMVAGTTLQMTAQMQPAGAQTNAAWSVDDASIGSIDQNGLLTGLNAGTVHVTAKTLDGSMISADNAITVTQPKTDIQASFSPSFTIVIPSEVDFGTLQKGKGIQEQPFVVEAKNLFVEDGSSIQVGVSSTFQMTNGSSAIPFLLYNGSSIISGGNFATFSLSHTQESGKITIETNEISNAGVYQGVLTFNISYVK